MGSFCNCFPSCFIGVYPLISSPGGRNNSSAFVCPIAVFAPPCYAQSIGIRTARGRRKQGMEMKEMEARRSVRKYMDRPVERELILKILDAARLAPSGNNTQPWRFIVVESGEAKERIVKADHDQKWMLSAPVLIACTADLHCRMDSPAPVDQNSGLPELKQVLRDTSIAVGYLLLEAERLGLSTCWTGWYDQREMQAALDLPADRYVCGVVTLGYGAEHPAPRPRKPLKELVEYR